MGRSRGFGSIPCDWAPYSDSVSLRLRGVPLKLATRNNSPAHSSIGRPSGIPEPCGSGIALRLLVGTRFQVLFHSPSGVLFTFPSRYLFAIGRQEYLALDGGPPSFPHERPSTWYSGGRSRRPIAFVYGAVTLSGLPFLTGSTSEWLGNSAGA